MLDKAPSRNPQSNNLDVFDRRIDIAVFRSRLGRVTNFKSSSGTMHNVVRINNHSPSWCTIRIQYTSSENLRKTGRRTGSCVLTCSCPQVSPCRRAEEGTNFLQASTCSQIASSTLDDNHPFNLHTLELDKPTDMPSYSNNGRS